MAIIGGTGIGHRLARLGGRRYLVMTPYGPFRFRETPTGLILVERHSAGHRNPPHRVNYRAIAAGMASIGVTSCLATAAVGSLRTDWTVGDLAACTDFLDLTGRRLTLRDPVASGVPFNARRDHVPFGVPMPLSALLLESAREEGLTCHTPAVYIGGDGPRYETPAEIRMMRGLGGDVVGMTAASEAILCGEAGVAYGCLAIITNLGTGLTDGQPHHEEVETEMERLGERVVSLLVRAADRSA